MDADALDRLLESERFTLRQAVAALRWDAADPNDDDAAGAEQRQRYAFLTELLHRHAQRLFGLIGQNCARQFAVEWQGSGYAPPRLDEPELAAELDAILAAVRSGAAPPPAIDRGRLEALLVRIDAFLDEEQAAWEASQSYAVG